MRTWAALAVVAALVVAAPASAHVDVLPLSVAQGEAQEFTIRVPNERSDAATVGVRVEFPSQITVFSLAPPPEGWTARPLRRPDGRLRGVSYAGGRIPVGGYADFEVLGTPFEAGTATWPVRQRYADGQVKPWTGPPEDPGAPAPETGPTEPGPAAAVQVAAPGDAPSAGATAGASGGGDDSDAGIWLGVIAIVIAAGAALWTGWLWSTRPARLPEDTEEPR